MANPRKTNIRKPWLCVVAAFGLICSGNLIAADILSIDTVDQAEQLEKAEAAQTDPQTNKAIKTKSDWSQFVPPLDEKFDWIQLTSGEWLKGDLKVMYNFILEFDSDELNLLKLDWEDIKQIRSAGTQSIRIENRNGSGEQTTLIGVLRLHHHKASVTFGDTVVEIDREQIVSIATGTSKEIDLWTGKIAFGMNARGGNSDLIDTNITANAKRRTAVSRIILEYTGNFSQVEGNETSNNHRLKAQYDQFKSANFFWRPIFGEYFRDSFKNINHQVSLGTAFGYHFIRTPKTEWEVSGGVGALYKLFVSVEAGKDINSLSPTAGFGTKYQTDLTKWLEYILDFSFQIVDKDSGSYIQHLLTTMSTDITGDLDFDVSFVWDRVQRPQPAADSTIPERDDYQIIVAIDYEF